MNYTEILSQMLMIVAVLTVFVNIITEVAKKAFYVLDNPATINLFVLGLSVLLTVAAFLGYWQIRAMVVTWYLVAAFVIVGFMVAYAAMFGYDKLMSWFSGVGT